MPKTKNLTIEERVVKLEADQAVLIEIVELLATHRHEYGRSGVHGDGRIYQLHTSTPQVIE